VAPGPVPFVLEVTVEPVAFGTTFAGPVPVACAAGRVGRAVGLEATGVAALETAAGAVLLAWEAAAVLFGWGAGAGTGAMRAPPPSIS